MERSAEFAFAATGAAIAICGFAAYRGANESASARGMEYRSWPIAAEARPKL